MILDTKYIQVYGHVIHSENVPYLAREHFLRGRQHIKCSPAVNQSESSIFTWCSIWYNIILHRWTFTGIPTQLLSVWYYTQCLFLLIAKMLMMKTRIDCFSNNTGNCVDSINTHADQPCNRELSREATHLYSRWITIGLYSICICFLETFVFPIWHCAASGCSYMIYCWYNMLWGLAFIFTLQSLEELLEWLPGSVQY